MWIMGPLRLFESKIFQAYENMSLDFEANITEVSVLEDILLIEVTWKKKENIEMITLSGASLLALGLLASVGFQSGKKKSRVQP